MPYDLSTFFDMIVYFTCHIKLYSKPNSIQHS